MMTFAMGLTVQVLRENYRDPLIYVATDKMPIRVINELPKIHPDSCNSQTSRANITFRLAFQ